MEIVFLLVWKMRQDIEFQKSRVLVTALLNQRGASEKQIQEAYEDLRNAFYPYERYTKVAEQKKLKQALEREINRGPLSVVAMGSPVGSRKNKGNLQRGEVRLQRREALQKLGQTTTMDPYNKAKKRPRGAS